MKNCVHLHPKTIEISKDKASIVFLDPICCSISPHSPRPHVQRLLSIQTHLSPPVPASHSSLLLSETRDAPNTVVFDSIKAIVKRGGWGVFPSGPLLASLWVAINERPFRLGKSGTVPHAFPQHQLLCDTTISSVSTNSPILYP